ncbi:MAG: hypothetical protein ISR50_04190 [Alphaproteobacteria bacterium]|nr:hypothetical protein [Alphaproteobacteria bacterium]MBL6951806.1 hypothetical protein [Alphaproteobacteria bacterium]
MSRLFPRTFLSNIRLAGNADEAGKSEIDLRLFGILPLDRLTAGKPAWLTRLVRAVDKPVGFYDVLTAKMDTAANGRGI